MRFLSARRRSTALLVAAMLALASAANAASSILQQQQQQQQELIQDTAAATTTTANNNNATTTAPPETTPAATPPPPPPPPPSTPAPTPDPTPPPPPYPQPDPAAAARAVGVTARGAVALPSLAYHASVPAETVAALARDAVARAAARARARKAAAAASEQDSASVDALAALDPRPDEKPSSAPAQVWKPLAAGVTASPMEIISVAEGERPLVLNGKRQAVYGPPPEKLLLAASSGSKSSSSNAAPSPSSSPRDAASSSTFSDPSAAPSGAGINGLGIPGGGASIEADGSGVCDRSCYNTITSLAQNPSPKMGGLNLGAEGAASFSGFSQQPSAERDAWRAQFVTAEGRNFKVGNSTWFFGGTNQYSLTQTDWWRDDQVETAMREHAARGAGAMRVFAFANGYGQDGYESSKMSRPFQPRLGTFSDDGLSRLDLVVSAAAKYGLRLILPLSNWWDEQGGCQWWVDQVYGRYPKQPKELFFSDPKVKEAFQDYIYAVITRRNPRMNNKPYSEEPAIMAWELMNEPQLSNDYDKKMGIPSGSVTSAWVREMAAFIKEVDGRKHLVSVGDEGWRSDVKGGFGGDWAWINDGTKGIDAATNVALPEVDFMTLHVYAPNWGFSADRYQWLLQNFVADRAALAAVANKPIVLEEFGSPYGYVPDRDAFLSAYTTAAAAFGYAGALIWQVFPWNTPNYQGAAFDFDYTKSGSAAVLALYDVMNAKTLFERVVASGKATGLIGK